MAGLASLNGLAGAGRAAAKLSLLRGRLALARAKVAAAQAAEARIPWVPVVPPRLVGALARSGSLSRAGFFGNALRRSRVPRATVAVRPPAALVSVKETIRERRERENKAAPGGLRSPWRYVRTNERARKVGEQLAAVIDAFLEEHPAVEGWLLDESFKGREKLRANGEGLLLERIAGLLGATSADFGKRSKWRSGIVRAYVVAAVDPETQLADWLEEGAPMGAAR